MKAFLILYKDFLTINFRIHIDSLWANFLLFYVSFKKFFFISKCLLFTYNSKEFWIQNKIPKMYKLNVCRSCRYGFYSQFQSKFVTCNCCHHFSRLLRRTTLQQAGSSLHCCWVTLRWLPLKLSLFTLLLSCRISGSIGPMCKPQNGCK